MLNFLLRGIEERIAAQKAAIAAGSPKRGLRLCPRCHQPLKRRRFPVLNRKSRLERWRCDPCGAWFRRGEIIDEASLAAEGQVS